MTGTARSVAALLAGCAALPMGCGEPGPVFGVGEIRAHVRSLAAGADRDPAPISLFHRVAQDLEAIELGELSDAVALRIPGAKVADHRTDLIEWGTGSGEARALEVALAPLAGAAVPLRLFAEAPTGAVGRLDIPRLFDLHGRVRPRVVALVDAGEISAALDLLAAWIELARGACARGPSGAPLAAMALTRPERILPWFGVERVACLDGSDAARLAAALRRAPSVAGWAAHNYLKDALLLLQDPALVEADLLGHRGTFFDPAFLETLERPLGLERDGLRLRCEAAISRTPLTEDALIGYADHWDDLVRSLAAVAAIDALRAAASGEAPPRVVLERGVVQAVITADLEARSVTYRLVGETELEGEISL